MYTIGERGGSESVALDKPHVIARGGEATVYFHPRKKNNIAIKIFRKYDPAREKKLRALFKKDLSRLPSSVVVPQEPVFNSKGQLNGYTMERFDALYKPLAFLGDEDFCAQYNITLKDIVKRYLVLFNDYKQISAAGWTAGDVNDKNERTHPHIVLPKWIDVDSWQFDGFPCPVATEYFVCPELYGVDYTHKPVFKPWHDIWSLTLLLTLCLVRAHAFRSGDHPRWKSSVLLRAKHGATIFDADVAYPKNALPQDIISDELKHEIINRLKMTTKSNDFPIHLLEEYGDTLVQCKQCALWYPNNRRQCPGCATKTLIEQLLSAKVAGCDTDTFIRVDGTILFFTVHNKTLYCVADERGMTALYTKEEHMPVSKHVLFPTIRGARFDVFNGRLVVCTDPYAPQPVLEVILDPSLPYQKVKLVNTEQLTGDQAQFHCSTRYVYRIVQGVLMRGELFSGRKIVETPVTSVLQNQTWFSAAKTADSSKHKQEVLFGCQRFLGDYQWFIVRGAGDGTQNKRFDIMLPLEDGESILDVRTEFDEAYVYVFRIARKRGVDYIYSDTISIANGKVTSKRVKIEDAPLYRSISGKACFNNIIMHPTNKGLVLESLKKGKQTRFEATENFVADSDELFMYGEDIVVKKRDRAILLTKVS